MKVSARDADARVRKPDPAIKAYLIYGPDRGLAHERATALVNAILADPDDPFALTQLTEEDLKSDPAALADAMAAMSLTGGQRLVRVRLSGETGNGPIVALISDIESGALAPETVLVVESGDLTPRGKLRKTFEPAKKALSIACYTDNTQSLGSLAEDLLQAEGLSLAPDARAAWLPRLEGDRALARGEIDKLILYKGLKGQRAEGDDTVTLEDVEAIAADQGEAQLDGVIEPALLGRAGRSRQGLCPVGQRRRQSGCHPARPAAAARPDRYRAGGRRRRNGRCPGRRTALRAPGERLPPAGVAMARETARPCPPARLPDRTGSQALGQPG